MYTKRLSTFAALLWIPLSGLCQQGNVASPDEEAEIKHLISQLVFADQKASDKIMLSPGVDDKSPEYKARYTACQEAFKKLSAFKDKAFPFLIEHLSDERQSIPFRNHFTGSSVGLACYWNLYFQLQDRPENYSSYGLMRKGRDGQMHTKPYWEGSPFGEGGDIPGWLQQNQQLSYPQQQIKCLTWLLEKEKAIGACDAASYYENILPLEIRILERRLEAGDNVESELNQLRQALKTKAPSAVPADLLPAKAKP